MRNSYFNLKDKIMKNKKKGFTLVEVIIVIAIIGMMISILVPKFAKYVNESKKLKVVEQSRKVVMAVESYNVKAENRIKEDNKLSSAMSNPSVSKYFEDAKTETNKLSDSMSIKDCYEVVNGKEFEINDDTGVFTGLKGNSSSSNT